MIRLWLYIVSSCCIVLCSVGMQASVDTRVIRNEDQLWRALLPRLLLAAQKMWRRGPYENLLKVSNVLGQVL